MCKFSIIVPVYNVEAYVAKCLASLHSQTYSDFEIIVIDDGSTDGSGAICRKFCNTEPRFKYVYQNNSGQAAARNHGIVCANGEYLIFVDADDWVEPRLLEVCKEVLDKTSVDFLNFRFDFITEDGLVKKIAKKYNRLCEVNTDILIPAFVEDQIYSVVWNKVFRKDLVLKYGIRFPNIGTNEDLYFTRSIAKFSKSTIYLNDILYHALVRHNSTSRTMCVASFKEAEDLLELEFERLVKKSPIEIHAVYFHIHAMKFLAYLLTQAAFRLPSYCEYKACAQIVNNNKYFTDGKKIKIRNYLPVKNRFIIYLSRQPALLRVVSRLISVFGVSPY